MRKLLIALLSVTVIFLAGCKNAGSEYIGEWQHVKYEKYTMKIERNGDSFMIRKTAPNMWNGKIRTENIPATFKDGTLQVGGFGMLSIDKATGNLVDGRNEFKKISS